MTGSSIVGGLLALASIALYLWSLRTKRELLTTYPDDKRVADFARKQAWRRGLVALLVATCGATIAGGDHVTSIGSQLALGAAGFCLTLAILSLVLADVWAGTRFVALDEAARKQERIALEKAVREWQESRPQSRTDDSDGAARDPYPTPSDN